MVVHGQTTWEQLQRLIHMLPADKKKRWTSEDASASTALSPKRFTTGAWNYGNQAGMMDASCCFPWVTRVLASVVRTGHSGHEFTSCTLSLNTVASPHKESRNLRGTLNLSLPCSHFAGGQLFVEDPEGRTRLQPAGPKGHLISMQEVATFSPHSLHATLPWRWRAIAASGFSYRAISSSQC